MKRVLEEPPPQLKLDVSSDAKDFVRWCLQKSQHTRPASADLHKVRSFALQHQCLHAWHLEQSLSACSIRLLRPSPTRRLSSAL
jgi:hypothetical protein